MVTRWELADSLISDWQFEQDTWDIPFRKSLGNSTLRDPWCQEYTENTQFMLQLLDRSTDEKWLVSHSQQPVTRHFELVRHLKNVLGRATAYMLYKKEDKNDTGNMAVHHAAEK
ncbi:hypothetical protein TNCV_192861 [Trichonephila clavipes]|nr:hypothetical protein TNCV_192861 [Trichonephila clavipes]